MRAIADAIIVVASISTILMYVDNTPTVCPVDALPKTYIEA